MPIVVRRATKEDAARIAEFATQLVEQHVSYAPERFSPIGTFEGMARFYGEQTEVQNASVLVLEKAGEIVGFAFMQFEPIIYAELATNVLWLHDIFVDVKVRALGMGKELIGAVTAEAKRFGANKILLSVAARNSVAQGFFKELGFETTMHEMMLVVGD